MHCFLIILIATPFLRVVALTTPRETVQKSLMDAAKTLSSNPLVIAAVPLPPDQLSEDVVFLQKSLNQRLEGLENLKRASRQWDIDFQSEFGVKASIGRVSTLSQNSVRVNWNVTWVPPTSLLLEGLGKPLRSNGVKTTYVSYNHLAQKPSTFSWGAVFKLFEDVLTKQNLRVPLACIEGSTELLFCDESRKVMRITEDLSYAEDLRRGVLQNRKCSQDLRLFLEVGRRMVESPQEWDDKVAVSLPWSSVAGSNPLDVDPVEEGPMAAVVFIGLAAFTVVLFAALMAPELIGQPLFGPPNYIVRPEDLNSLY